MSLAGGERVAPARLRVMHGRGGFPQGRAGAGVPSAGAGWAAWRLADRVRGGPRCRVGWWPSRRAGPGAPPPWGWPVARCRSTGGTPPRPPRSTDRRPGEEGHQRIIPADDDRQGGVLCGDAIATHTYLPRCGWYGAVPGVGGRGLAGAPGAVRRPGGCTRCPARCATAASRPRAGDTTRSPGGSGPARPARASFTNVARRRSATTYKRTLSAARRCCRVRVIDEEPQLPVEPAPIRPGRRGEIAASSVSFPVGHGFVFSKSLCLVWLSLPGYVTARAHRGSPGLPPLLPGGKTRATGLLGR